SWSPWFSEEQGGYYPPPGSYVQGLRCSGSYCDNVSVRSCYPVSYADITGVWRGDDGGMYYIRQVGSEIWWLGMSTRSSSGYLDFFKGLDFTNVFHGTISGQRISGEWADVSRGTARSSGTLVM